MARSASQGHIWLSASAGLGLVIGGAAVIGGGVEAPAAAQPVPSVLEAMCTPEAVQALASGLSDGVTIKAIKWGAPAKAVTYNAAKGQSGAFCQVTGTFTTNKASGKTATFFATFPASWNGKYLQLGCSGHCGQYFVSNPALPPITVTAQGYPGQIIEKGYAAFATDEGHEGMDAAKWAIKADGSVDVDYVDDFLYRADKVLAHMGKEFTTAFYGQLNGASRKISHSYFSGCSGGGRDAMVAASYFPDQFDGIIAGSPYNAASMGIQASMLGALASRPGAKLTPALLALVDKAAKNKCDVLDGVSDGLIQNPAACNFQAERDLPICKAGETAGQCFTKPQAETVSAALSAMTDERGNVIAPGYAVSEFNLMPENMALLGDGALKVFVHKNDPGFVPASLFSFRRGGPGPAAGFHAVVPAAEAAKVLAEMRLGAGHILANQANLMASKTKLMIWHNFSDQLLTPYSSINWYKALAASHGGYAKVQNQARLFLLPGTTHCSISGIAPNSFDAIGAMEAWVEKGEAPDAMKLSVAARDYTPGAPKSPNLSTPQATMPLCKFPEMARYSGKGDVKDAANWSCTAGDRRLLQLGSSGREAGVSR